MKPEILFATTPTLRIAYEQAGPISGDPVLLLHGFPYDVREFDAVRNRLTGRRVIVPYLRGFGPTRYRSPQIMRSGQQAALGKDVVDLLDALDIPQATLVGYDWGGRAACVAAALWPERVRALISVGGYTIQNIAKSAADPESPEQEQQYWYQWYFQLERGRAGLEANRQEICKLLWKVWSPTWAFDDKLFRETTQSFDNPDFVATVIQSYRQEIPVQRLFGTQTIARCRTSPTGGRPRCGRPCYRRCPASLVVRLSRISRLAGRFIMKTSAEFGG